MRPSYGSVAEWFKAAVLKTADSQGSQSSNLCASAIFEAPFLWGFLLSEEADFKGRRAGKKEEFRNYFGTVPKLRLFCGAGDCAEATIDPFGDVLFGMA